MFGRRDTSKTATRDPGVGFLYDTPHDEIVQEFLERAQRRAEELESGESFEIALVEGWPVDVDYMEIVSPVMMRAHEFGLMPGYCFDGTFQFIKP